MKINNSFLRISIALIFMASAIFIAYDYGFLRFNYSSAKYTIHGIDVSHHQGNIEWEQINKKKVKFVYIKATEGRNYQDDKFLFNWQGAREKDLFVGAYHFFTFCKSGKEQAENFIKTVPNEPDSLPPVIDLEFLGNCKNNKTKEEVIEDIRIMEKMLSEHYNKKTIFYTTKEFYKNYLMGSSFKNELWFRDVFKEPKIKDGKIVFWQYWHHGRLDGIETPVDLNVFYGTRKDIIKLTYPTVQK